MTPRVSSGALRPLVFVALLLVPMAGGCLGGEGEGAPRLAQPTDRPISVPLGRPATPPPPVDFTDPGYRMEGSWKVGDGWDYASNRSRSMLLRVTDMRVQGGVTSFKLETTRLGADGSVEGKSVGWVDARSWSRVNATDEKGNVDRFVPGMPLRFFKNGTVSFEHTRTDAAGRVVVNESLRLQAYVHPRAEVVQARFGDYYETRKVEQVTSASGARARTLVVHWPHRDVLNDVAFQLESGERYLLTAFKANDTRRGTLADASSAKP